MAAQPPVKTREKRKANNSEDASELKGHQDKTRYTKAEYNANDKVAEMISERVGLKVTQSELTRALWAMLRLCDDTISTIHDMKFEKLVKCAKWNHDTRAENEMKLVQLLQAIAKETQLKAKKKAYNNKELIDNNTPLTPQKNWGKDAAALGGELLLRLGFAKKPAKEIAARFSNPHDLITRIAERIHKANFKSLYQR